MRQTRPTYPLLPLGRSENLLRARSRSQIQPRNCFHSTRPPGHRLQMNPLALGFDLGLVCNPSRRPRQDLRGSSGISTLCDSLRVTVHQRHHQKVALTATYPEMEDLLGRAGATRAARGAVADRQLAWRRTTSPGTSTARSPSGRRERRTLRVTAMCRIARYAWRFHFARRQRLLPFSSQSSMGESQQNRIACARIFPAVR